MNNKVLGSIIIVLALLVFFSTKESAWIISAVLLGAGSGIFIWKK
jgi:flagellar biosynthesis protein FliR|tara:strand:+ start:89 stop:223 length:135 start_codon:yes stop_codon:yes gene_type:complete